MADKEKAPASDGGQELAADQGTSSRELYREMERRADHELRVAWLTVHADLLYGVDEGGLLSAQLLDLRDVLETLDRDGRVEW